MGECHEYADSRIVKLEHDIAEMCGSWQEAVETQGRQARALQERLKQTEELLEARAAKLSRAGRLSEIEMLSIVHHLDENTYKIAVSLTEE